MKDLAGKTAVITGAASGMGRAFAERFAAAGMNVVLADVEVPRLEEATAAVAAQGVEAIAVPTDVSDADAVDVSATPPSRASGACTWCATTPASPAR